VRSPVHHDHVVIVIVLHSSLCRLAARLLRTARGAAAAIAGLQVRLDARDEVFLLATLEQAVPAAVGLWRGGACIREAC
jgi:hypothetical protein